MYSNRLFSPLRYPGGKARFAPFVTGVIEANDLAGCHYLEPYAGGAGVALDLLFGEVAEHIHINDLDSAVYDFWIAVTEHSETLLALLSDTDVTMDEWHRWRSVMLHEVEGSAAERGFATLFMNRTNRSGILKGGVIGGKAQAGAYRLDARFKKDVLASRIERIADESDRISVYCEDAESLLRRCKKFLPLRSLIFLDPPYYVKGQGLYRNFYEAEDHSSIASLLQLKSFNRSWIVSYDRAPEIAALYRDAPSIDYRVYYTAQSRYDGAEQMFFSKRLNIGSLALLPPERSAAAG